MTNRVFGGLCITLAIFFVYFASKTEVRFLSDPIGPKFFPYMIGLLLAGAGLVTTFDVQSKVDWPSSSGILEIVVATGMMVLYTVLLPIVGFLTCSSVAAGYLSWRMGSKPLVACITGVTIATTLFLLFHHVLRLTLATGPWGF